MAVIYETKDDYAKAQLKEQADELHLKSSHESGLGMAFLGLGIAADNYNLRKAEYSGKLAWVSGFLQLFGVIETIKSFFTAGKAHDRIHELERMGPQVFAMPHPDASSFNIHAFDNFDVPSKVFTQTIQPSVAIDPQTLFEHAENKGSGERLI